MELLSQSPSSLKNHKKMEKHLRVLRRNPVSLQFSEGNMEDPGNYWTVTSNPEKMVEQLILVVISKHVGKGYQE